MYGQQEFMVGRSGDLANLDFFYRPGCCSVGGVALHFGRRALGGGDIIADNVHDG